MSIQLICTSHSPLIGLPGSPLPLPACETEFRRRMKLLKAKVAEFAPDLVVLFAPDHFNSFYYDVMPPFCIAAAGEAAGDFGGPIGALSIDTGRANDLTRYLLESDFDPAVSYSMRLDHGFLQPLSFLFDDLHAVPLVPIYINSVTPPHATTDRCRAFGAAVGDWIGQLEERVLVIGSGGLSHDPPVPAIDTASQKQRDFMIHGRAMPSTVSRERELGVLARVQEFYHGEGDLLPLNPEWDQWLINRFTAGDLAAVAALTTPEILAAGGRGGQEIRTWVAAFAALASAGPYEIESSYYSAANEWFVGLGLMSAAPTRSAAGQSDFENV